VKLDFGLGLAVDDMFSSIVEHQRLSAKGIVNNRMVLDSSITVQEADRQTMAVLIQGIADRAAPFKPLSNKEKAEAFNRETSFKPEPDPWPTVSTPWSTRSCSEILGDIKEGMKAYSASSEYADVIEMVKVLRDNSHAGEVFKLTTPHGSFTVKPEHLNSGPLSKDLNHFLAQFSGAIRVTGI